METPSLSKLSISLPYPSPLRGKGDSESAKKFFDSLSRRKMKSIKKREEQHEAAYELYSRSFDRAEDVHNQRMKDLKMQTESLQEPFTQTLYLGVGTWPVYTFDKLRTDFLIPENTAGHAMSVHNRLVIWSSRDFDPEDDRKSQWYTPCIGNEDCGYVNEWYTSLKELFTTIQSYGRIQTGDLFISMKSFIGMHWTDLYWVKKQSGLRNIYIIDYYSTSKSSNRWLRYATAERRIRQYDIEKDNTSVDPPPSSNASTASTEGL